MKNRESLYPGRVKLTPVDAANGIYDMIRADEPQEVGTPLNKKLLDFAVAACGVTSGTATAYTLDDEFGGFELVDGAKVNFRLHVANGDRATLNINGTGAKPIKSIFGSEFPSGVPEGTWITAKYSVYYDAYITNSEYMRSMAGSYVGDGAGISNITVTFDFMNYVRSTSVINYREIVLAFDPQIVMLFEENNRHIGTIHREAPFCSTITGVHTANWGQGQTASEQFTTNDLSVPYMKIDKNKLLIADVVAVNVIQQDPVITSTIQDAYFTTRDSNVGYNTVGKKYHYIAF